MTNKEVLERKLVKVLNNTDFLKEITDNDIIKQALVIISNDLFETLGVLTTDEELEMTEKYRKD